MGEKLARAIALRADGQHTAALSLLQDLVRAQPDDCNVHYQLACTYDNEGMEDRAIDHYEACLQDPSALAPADRRDALLGLGSTYRCLEQYGDAVRVLNRGLQENPSAEEFRVFLALCHHNLGQHQDAVSALLHHIAQFSSHADTAKYRRALHTYANQPDPPYEI